MPEQPTREHVGQAAEIDKPFELGNPKVNAAGFDCCGKPRGCDMTHDGCAYLRHPWKRAMVFNEPDAPCVMEWADAVSWEPQECSLLNGHAGPCQPIRRVPR